jgi:hypothetical protein
MAATFGEKFEQALADLKAKDPEYGLRTLARTIAHDDPQQAEIIRRRLYKYRPPKGGGTAIVPTEPTRREIEKAMGLKRDALKPDAGQAAAMVDDLMAQLAPMRAAARLADMVERGELVMAR